MQEHSIKQPENDVATIESSSPTVQRGIILCALAFVLCILINITPLTRMSGTTELRALPTNILLVSIGTWLPLDLGLASTALASQMSTHVILFTSLLALEFAIYGLSLYWLRRRLANADTRSISRIMWLAASAAGLACILTPALLSHDIYAYAGYGRLVSVYHANPYFVTLAAYPQDPLSSLDNWRATPSAYGPIWSLICALVAICAGSQPLAYVFLYRILGYAAYLLNIFLISKILRATGRSPRTVALGTLLYAWNPLVLQESCLSGHNDTVMITFLLLGVLYCVKAERTQFRRWRDYLPALLAFTLSVLIKFASAPLIVFFCVLLIRKTLYPATRVAWRELRWRPTIKMCMLAILVSGGLILGLYAPFWIGHSLHEIIQSFVSPPAASATFGSVLEATQKWVRANGLPAGGAGLVLSLLSSHNNWRILNYSSGVSLLLLGCYWIWRDPTTRTVLLSSLALLAGLITVTAWFVPWYATWLIGLLPLCLPALHERRTRALLAFALTFSASANFIYFYFPNFPPIGGWIGWACLSTIGPPIIVLLLALLLPPAKVHFRAYPKTSILAKIN